MRGVDAPIRETYESALTMGATLLRHFGETDERVDALMAEVRLRDADRFALQLAGDITAGRLRFESAGGSEIGRAHV